MTSEEVKRLMDVVEYTDVEKPRVPSKKGIPYVIKEGVLRLGDYEIKAYVLSDGQRVYDADDFAAFFSDLLTR